MIKKIIINILITLVFMTLIYSNKLLVHIPVLPDIILVFTLFNSFYFGSVFGMFYGFFAGLAFDFSTYEIFGFNALNYALIGFLVTFIEKKIDMDNPIMSSLIVMIYFIIKTVIFLLIALMFLTSGEIIDYFKRVFLLELLFTLIFSIPVFLIYKKINLKSRKR